MQKLLTINFKIFLYLITILKHPISDKNEEQLRWINYCQQDFQNFPLSFSGKEEYCLSLLNDIEIKTNVGSEINKIFGARQIQYGLYQKNIKIVLKHLTDENKLERIRSHVCEHVENCENIWQNQTTANNLKTELINTFNDPNRIDGLKICPQGYNDRFIKVFAKSSLNSLYTWLLLNLNAEPYLLPAFQKNGFPVPFVYRMCGFVLVQSYSGAPLYDFYDHPFTVRVYIAKQLLEAALQFTEGIDGFRIYFTDATPDNIVVDNETHKISFVDLDNVIVQDSHHAELFKNSEDYLPPEWASVHKHEKIDCDGCFAYIPTQLCSHHLSDINIFATCQLLKEDLHGNIEKGLLHSIPDDILTKFPTLPTVLDECMNCGCDCDNRFDQANLLIEIFETVLNNKI